MQATWSPSGDARSYKRGATGAPAAAMAWELALRWSAIDLDDGGVAGGRVEQLGIAATCYLDRHVRVVGNLLAFDSRRNGVSHDPFVAGLRLQFTY